MSTRKLSNEQFIARAESIHGSKYCYQNAVYVNMSTKLTVMCNICNHTWQVSPANHIGTNCSGCPNCKATKSKSHCTKCPDMFISEVSVILPDYDYSKTCYINTKTKVTVSCKLHGTFNKWPSDLLNGSGCPYCAGQLITTEQFVQDAMCISPQYDYSKVVYVRARDKVTVICPLHGAFDIRPNDIKSGIGCRQCASNSAFAKRIESGLCRHPDNIPELDKYRQAVWKITNRQFNEHYYAINPNNYKRGHKYHLDHKYPIILGFNNNVSPEIIGSHHNLQLLSASANRKKGASIDMLLDELISKVDNS